MSSVVILDAVVFEIVVYHFVIVGGVDLIKWVSNVHPPVLTSTKSLFDFNEIWYVRRGR